MAKITTPTIDDLRESALFKILLDVSESKMSIDTAGSKIAKLLYSAHQNAELVEENERLGGEMLKANARVKYLAAEVERLKAEQENVANKAWWEGIRNSRDNTNDNGYFVGSDEDFKLWYSQTYEGKEDGK